MAEREPGEKQYINPHGGFQNQIATLKTTHFNGSTRADYLRTATFVSERSKSVETETI
jgi:hypothetical protein